MKKGLRWGQYKRNKRLIEMATNGKGTMKIGFVGLGQMGKWMAGNIAKQGFDITVFDIDSAAMDFPVEQGAIPARSLSDISIGSEIVILSLPNDEIAEKVIFDNSGIAGNARPGTILVDCGTSGYVWTRNTAERLAKQEIFLLDAPVTGLEEKAKAATLTIMVGGGKNLFEKIRPVLASMSNTISHMGDVGSGQLAKMINNVIYNINIASLAEMLPMVVKLGLAPDKIADVINSGSGRSFASEYFIPKMFHGRFRDSYSLGNAYKDMQHMEEAASRLDISLPLFQSARDTYCRALDEGLGDEDKGAMIKVFEKEMGVLFRK